MKKLPRRNRLRTSLILSRYGYHSFNKRIDFSICRSDSRFSNETLIKQALDITVKPSIMKKIKIKRKDNSPIIGRKKSLTFTISSDLEQLSKASEKAFCINEVDSNEWSISYINDEMENNNEIIEFVFSVEDWNKTLNEIKAIYWKNDIIEDEFEFIAVTD